jgi:hypothetical protein
MPEPELFLHFVRPVNRSGIRYIIVGSVATIFYGDPRMTHDVDFVAFLNNADIHRLPVFFPATEFYLPPVEVILVETAREQHGHFNILHLATGFKADFFLTGRDELNAWAFRNKRRVLFEGEPLILAPPECVIVRKLEYYREGGSDKHLEDIRSMLRLSGEQIDRAVLNEWIVRQGVQQQWQEIVDHQ